MRYYLKVWMNKTFKIFDNQDTIIIPYKTRNTIRLLGFLIGFLKSSDTNYVTFENISRGWIYTYLLQKLHNNISLRSQIMLIFVLFACLFKTIYSAINKHLFNNR